VVYYEYETCCSPLRKEHKIENFENRWHRKICGPERKEGSDDLGY
jgi:hypothetical protein